MVVHRDGFGQWKDKVEKDMRELFRLALSRPKLDQIKGAPVVISEGGSLRVLGPDGTVLLYVGNIGIDLPDGAPQYGFRVKRRDGSTALVVYDPLPAVDGENQFVALLDRAQNIIFSDDTTSGVGIGRPYLPIQFGPSSVDGLLSSDSATFFRILEALPFKQHPRGYVQLRHSTDIGGTTGEVQVLANGSVVAGPWPVVFGYGYSQQDFDMPGGHETSPFLEVQVRRTAGTGRVFASVISAYGVAS